MILWVLLFIGVVVVSLLLALRSMRDYQEIPESLSYGLFLIRKPKVITEVFNLLHDEYLKAGKILSFERLFKGTKSTLVIFGPRSLLKKANKLDLLELEDYTEIDSGQISIWEVGIRSAGKREKIFTRIPPLLNDDQIWWQVVLSRSFKPQIKVVVLSKDPSRRENLSRAVENLAPDKLFRLPKGFTNALLLDFYQKRSFKNDNQSNNLSAEEVLGLIVI